MAGRLVLVTGPRGAGKTSLIAGARRRLKADARFAFPLRVISHPGAPGDETLYRTVTPAQFDCLRRAGRLALCWHRDGVNYALPAEIDQHLARGRVVVAEVAMQALPQARRGYPAATIVGVTAAAVERRRRLSRHDISPAWPPESGVPLGEANVVLRNEGRLGSAIDRLVAVLEVEARRVVRADIRRSVANQGSGIPPLY